MNLGCHDCRDYRPPEKSRIWVRSIILKLYLKKLKAPRLQMPFKNIGILKERKIHID